jgi:hypothetical protein
VFFVFVFIAKVPQHPKRGEKTGTEEAADDDQRPLFFAREE